MALRITGRAIALTKDHTARHRYLTILNNVKVKGRYNVAHQQQDVKVTTPAPASQAVGVIGGGHPSPVQQGPLNSGAKAGNTNSASGQSNKNSK